MDEEVFTAGDESRSTISMINYLLNKLFKRNSSELSKVEYWHKWHFFELIKHLHKAKDILSEYSGGISVNFSSAEEFYENLEDEIDWIEFGNKTDLTKIWKWFAPTCDWDDIVGIEGEQVANQIFNIADNWYQHECVSKEEE